VKQATVYYVYGKRSKDISQARKVMQQPVRPRTTTWCGGIYSFPPGPEPDPGFGGGQTYSSLLAVQEPCIGGSPSARNSHQADRVSPAGMAVQVADSSQASTGPLDLLHPPSGVGPRCKGLSFRSLSSRTPAFSKPTPWAARLVGVVGLV
jgi:hypothetical protein